MARTFADALRWHMDRDGTKIAELASGAGVSTDVIKKLRTRGTSSTAAETAARIAAFYGKNITAFLECRDAAPGHELDDLLPLLTTEEKRILAAQVKGLLASRAR